MDLVAYVPRDRRQAIRARARLLANILRIYAWNKLGSPRVLGLMIKKAPGDLALIDGLVYDSTYPVIYYLLVEIAGSDEKFRHIFLNSYLIDRDYRSGVNYVLTLMESEDNAVVMHPAYRLVSEKFQLRKILERVVKV